MSKNAFGPDQFGSMGRGLACELKNPVFNSGHRNLPRLQVLPHPGPLVGALQEIAN